MKTLDHIQNPPELIKLAIFSSMSCNIKICLSKNRGILYDLTNHSFNPMYDIITNELDQPSIIPMQIFNSDTRLKLLFINSIYRFNFHSSHIQLKALGWDRWIIHDLASILDSMNLSNWMTCYHCFREFGICYELINEYDHIHIDDFEERFKIEYH